MLILGITGTFGSGKSLVAKIFKKLGVPVVDADCISHIILKSKEGAAVIIKEKFGTTNRKKLAEIVFSHQKKKKELESILHPAIMKRIKQELSTIKSPLAVVEAPLLFETGIPGLVDKVLVVSAKKEIILKRALASGKFKKEQILKRIKSQIPLNEKEKKADFVIDNNGIKEETKKQVKKIYQEIIKKGRG